MQCKGKTKAGYDCKNKAIKDGYCKMHHPDEIAKKEEKIKESSVQKEKIHEVLELIENTARAKGWSYRLDSYDSKYNRYATIVVRKNVESDSYSSTEIVGSFNITVDDSVKVGYSNTSFHGYGLRDLQGSIMNELSRLSWLESKKMKKGNLPEIESIWGFAHIPSKIHTKTRKPLIHIN